MVVLRSIHSLEYNEPEETSRTSIRGKGIIEGYLYKEGKKR
jgi:hypothetical protein